MSGTISLAAGAGCCNLLSDGTSERWRIVNHEQGAWITPAFTAADYNGNGSMTWTVDSADVTSAAYYLRGRVLHINIMIVNSSVGGTPNTELQRVIPGGFTAFRSADIVNFGRDNGTFFADGICHVNAGESVLRFFRNPSFQNWQASNNQSNISVCAALAVQ